MSSRPARRAALVASLVLLAGIAWAAVVLLRGSAHDAVSGAVPPGAFVEDVAPRGEACQPLPALAEPASRAVLTVGTYERPSAPVELVARAGERQLATSGQVAAPNGVVTMRLRPALQPADGALFLCLRNLGAGRVAVAGVSYPPPPGSAEPGRALSIRLVGRDESHLSRVGRTLDRYASARAGDFGGWVLILAFVLFAGAALGAVAMLVRDASGQSPPGSAG